MGYRGLLIIAFRVCRGVFFALAQERKVPILDYIGGFFDLLQAKKEPTEREIEWLEVP